jgi:hypothetical protein
MIKLKIYVDDEPIVKVKAEKLGPLKNVWKDFIIKMEGKKR